MAAAKIGTLGGSNRMIDAQAVAELLGVAKDTVYDQWRTWGLNGYKIGRHLRFREREVEAWISQQAA